MSSRSFTVFQDVPTSEAVKAKPASANIMATRSSARLNKPLEPPPLGDGVTANKENVHPVTGERAGATPTSKKRKTNALTTKATAPLAVKKAKPSKEGKDTQTQPERQKRKGTSGTTKNKPVPKKDGKTAGSSRKPPTKRLTRKVSQLPCLEEETVVKDQDTEHITQATIDSRCYELTVQPLADVSQAYDTIEATQEASPGSKIKFRKDASAEPDIRDFFSSSQTLVSFASTSTIHTTPTKSVENRKFSTPERKQIYAAFTFSTPSPTSERISKSLSRSGSMPRLNLA